MVSTPKSPNTSSTSNDSNSSKVNIMSPYHQDFSQYIDLASTESPQVKSGEFDPAILYDYEVLMGNDIFHAETPIYDFSPVMSSSMTTPSLVLDGISTPQDLNDSPLFNNTSSFAASPSLEPPIGFFPDLTADPTVAAAAAARRSYMISIAPSVTIPVDDSSPITIPGNSNPSSALNIPWNPEATGSSSTDDLLQNASTSSPLMSNYSDINTANNTGNNTANNSPKSSSTAASSPSMPSLSKLTTRNRKRSNGDVDKDPQIMADELALKRAKNTDAARRSRLRRVMKMESLEKQVAELKGENNDLQTRIAVLESEKKGLEDKNAEKDARVKLLEQQLAEAHERLIKRTSIL